MRTENIFLLNVNNFCAVKNKEKPQINLFKKLVIHIDEK